MTPENQQKFYIAFPNLFKTECYLQCNDGWFDILYDLCGKLENLLNKYLENDLSDDELSLVPYVTCIKEKFATLRFYISSDDESFTYINDFNQLIKKAELKTAKICEICGNQGVVRSLTYLKVLCESHYDDSKFILYNKAINDYLKHMKHFKKGNKAALPHIHEAKKRMALYQ